MEKETDNNKIITFLEKVLDCESVIWKIEWMENDEITEDIVQLVFNGD